MFTVDLETSFAGKGSKRKDAWILQLGAASSTHVLDILVRPPFRSVVRSPEDLHQELKWAKQQPKMTINFWARVLERSTNVRRDCTRAEYIIKHIKKMMPLRSALLRLIAFTGTSATWWAHNGKSFDFPILRGNAERVDVELDDITMKDSLPVVRKAWPLDKSHALTKVYANHISTKPYKAHLAADDAIALKVLEKAPSSAEPHRSRRKARSFCGVGWARAASGLIPAAWVASGSIEKAYTRWRSCERVQKTRGGGRVRFPYGVKYVLTCRKDNMRCADVSRRV